MSFIGKLIPSASRALRTYYWLYIAGIVLPILQQQIPRIKAGNLSFWDVVEIAIIILVPAISGTLAYADKHNEAKEGE